MIIKTSSMHMSAEHEKTSFSSISSTMGTGMLENGFGFQLQELLDKNEQSGALRSAQMAGLSIGSVVEEWQSFGSALLVTPLGARFQPVNTRADSDDPGSQGNRTKAMMWQSLLNALNPNSRPVTRIDDIALPDDQATATNAPRIGEGISLKPVSIQMQFRATETIEEYECTQFSSCGAVTTADGQSIEFDLSLKMERSYAATREFQVTQEVVFTDPLILNFEGNYADLSDEKFEFDLDADGNAELISYLTGSSGMLALDKNEDGIINDGSELFGALTGNGFEELAEYDEDGNGYIDEADSIFDQLMIWNKTVDNDSLESLASRDIGAIYLGSSETPFDIKGENNQHNGTVRNSGVYFTENGEVGTLQQIDMVV